MPDVFNRKSWKTEKRLLKYELNLHYKAKKSYRNRVNARESAW